MDIAIVNTSANDDLSFDLLMNGPDLAQDQGLRTAVIISLFSDRRAADDDTIPDGSNDRRGFWGDLPLDVSSGSATTYILGSRLWLLARAKATQQTAAQAQRYCLEALQWLLDDGVAQDISVTTQWLDVGFLGIGIQISELKADGSLADHRYDLIWAAALSGSGVTAGPANTPKLDFSDPGNFTLGGLRAGR